MELSPTRVMTGEESDGGAEMEGKLQVRLPTAHGCLTGRALFLQRPESSQELDDLC